MALDRIGLIRICAACALFAVSACAVVPDTAAFATATPEATQHKIYVVSQQATPLEDVDLFDDRPDAPRRAAITVSIPPVHQIGEIEWHQTEPDPLLHFAVTEVDPFEGSSDLLRTLRATQGDEVILFVHGYNTTTSEALYRYAQIIHDFEITEPRVMFSWASAGVPPAYVYDRDSILFGRDALVDLVTDVTRRGGKRVNILGHSMGSQLIMEMMRDLAIAGDRDVLNAIQTIALIAPDIDPDVFRAQTQAIGDLPQPFIIMASEADVALRASSRLAGGRDRMGQIGGADDVADLGVTYIDLTRLSDGTAMNHLTPVTSPRAISIMRQLVETATPLTSGFAEFVVLDTDGVASVR